MSILLISALYDLRMYTMHTEVAIILLLNLIIAVMSAVVDKVDNDTYQAGLMISDHLNEILAIEAMTQLFLLPCGDRLRRFLVGSSCLILLKHKTDVRRPNTQYKFSVNSIDVEPYKNSMWIYLTWMAPKAARNAVSLY